MGLQVEQNQTATRLTWAVERLILDDLQLKQPPEVHSFQLKQSGSTVLQGCHPLFKQPPPAGMHALGQAKASSWKAAPLPTLERARRKPVNEFDEASTSKPVLPLTMV